jgi:hypothetical protein
MEFRVQPEEKLYPHLQFIETGDLDFSISLPFTNFDHFIADSSFLIDTTYFFEFDKNFMEYRRIYSYDNSFRIKSIIAEVLREDIWYLHQRTELSYNKIGNVVQINYGRYEEKLDSIIIYYLFDTNGLLLEERAEITGESEPVLKNGWRKKYFYDNKSLVKYTFEKVGHPNRYETDSVKCKYGTENLLVERTDFEPDVYIDSSKFNWIYNKEQKLIEHNYFTFRRSDTLSRNTTQYEYNEIGKISKKTNVERNEFDNFPEQLEWDYKYNETGRLDTIYLSLKILLENKDSLSFIGTTIFDYSSDDFLIGYQMLDKYIEKFWTRRTIFTRDSNNNITFAQKENFSGGSWRQGPSIRIIYRKRLN